MDKKLSDELRKPFPEGTVGKLPKGGALLDFVGHAAITDRLLTVDHEWTWEPLALDEHGLPAVDAAGNLWIRLTVGGVTRIGVGDGKNMKERIGDALRNAAMRFGVALSLWSKDELESGLVEHVPEVRQHASSNPPPGPKMRAGNAAYALWPNADVLERRKLVNRELQAIGATFDTATEEQWLAVAQELEARNAA